MLIKMIQRPLLSALTRILYMTLRFLALPSFAPTTWE